MYPMARLIHSGSKHSPTTLPPSALDDEQNVLMYYQIPTSTCMRNKLSSIT